MLFRRLLGNSAAVSAVRSLLAMGRYLDPFRSKWINAAMWVNVGIEFHRLAAPHMFDVAGMH
jgi:hypothetical protein